MASRLEQLSDRVYRLPGAVNVALVAHRGRAVIIDSGQDDSYGRRIRQALEALELTPAAIVNTHAHADHYGGNRYLLKRFELPVYAPPFERALMANPRLEPIYLFHGASPIAELTGKWLLAPASRSDRLLEPGPLEIAGIDLEVLDTSGHAHVHRSILVDDVLIAADALFGTAVLERYPLPFAQDVSGQIDSLLRLRGLAPALVLPGHGEPASDHEALVERNLDTIAGAADAVATACSGAGTEAILAATCRALGIDIGDLPRYYLNLCTVAAYLSHLRSQRRIDVRLVDGAPRWSRTTT